MWQHVSVLLTSHHQAIHKFRLYERKVLLLMGSHYKKHFMFIRSKFLYGLMTAR
jgi:hypothetical protein